MRLLWRVVHTVYCTHGMLYTPYWLSNVEQNSKLQTLTDCVHRRFGNQRPVRQGIRCTYAVNCAGKAKIESGLRFGATWDSTCRSRAKARTSIGYWREARKEAALSSLLWYIGTRPLSSKAALELFKTQHSGNIHRQGGTHNYGLFRGQTYNLEQLSRVTMIIYSWMKTGS